MDIWDERPRYLAYVDAVRWEVCSPLIMSIENYTPQQLNAIAFRILEVRNNVYVNTKTIAEFWEIVSEVERDKSLWPPNTGESHHVRRARRKLPT